MKLKNFLWLFIFLLLTNCSVTDSDSDPNEIHGSIIGVDGEPSKNIKVGVIYTFSEAQADPSLPIYPNPFDGTTNIQFQLETETDYKITAQNLKTSYDTTIVDEVLPSGSHRVTWSPHANFEMGLYELSDNLGNESILFYAPGFPISVPNISNTIAVAGLSVGDVHTTTNEKGKFKFDKHEIFNTYESFLITNEAGLEQGTVVLEKELYLVAFKNSETFAAKLVHYEDLTNGFELQLTKK